MTRYAGLTDDHNTTTQEQHIQLEELFTTSGGQPASRILAEGDGGFGKTTLAIKLAADWAKDTEYMKSRFQMVLLIPLSDVRDTALDQAIVNMLSLKSCGELSDFFTKNKTLLILDGLDEMTPEGLQNLWPVLCGDSLTSTCVLATSRRGVITERESVQYSAPVVVNPTPTCSDVNWDHRVRLKGFSVDQTKEFLRSNFEIDWNDVKIDVEEILRDMKEMFRCPLYVFFLGRLLEEKVEPYRNKIRTKTSFFKSIINLVLHKALVGEGQLEKNGQLDVFSDVPQAVKLKQEMAHLGCLALSKLIARQYFFTENDVRLLSNNVFLKSDIIVRYTNVSKYIEETYYKPMHHTLMEFLAAFFVCFHETNFENNVFNKLRWRVPELVKKGLVPSSDSMFYPFLAGLLGDKAAVLFENLSPWKAIFHADRNEMKLLLNELENVSENTVNTVLDFVPGWYRIEHVEGIPNRYYRSEFHGSLLEAALKKKLIRVLTWEMDVLCELPPTSEKLDKIIATVSDETFSTSLPASVHAIECKEVVYKISNKKASSEAFLSPLSWFIADQCHLQLDIQAQNVEAVLASMKERARMNRPQFRSVRLVVRDSAHLTLLTEMLRNHFVTKGIHVLVYINNLGNIWNEILRSDSIDEASFNVEPELSSVKYEQPESKLKYFDMLEIDDVIIEQQDKAKFIKSVQKLKLTTDLNEKKSLHALRDVETVHYLECCNKIFSRAYNNVHSILKSAREAHVWMRSGKSIPLNTFYFINPIHSDSSTARSSSEEEEASLGRSGEKKIWKTKTNRIDLREFNLRIRQYVQKSVRLYKYVHLKALTINFTLYSPPIDIISLNEFLKKVLHRSDLRYLGLSWMPIEMLPSFIPSLNIVLQETRSKIDTLQIHLTKWFDELHTQHLLPLKTLLNNREVAKLAFIDVQPYLGCALAQVFSENEFHFGHEVDGIQMEHSMSSCYHFNYEHLSNHRLVITKKEVPLV